MIYVMHIVLSYTVFVRNNGEHVWRYCTILVCIQEIFDVVSSVPTIAMLAMFVLLFDTRYIRRLYSN